MAKIEAVLEHRRALVETRTLMLHYAADQIAKLPTEIRDQLSSHGRIESRLRRLETINVDLDLTVAGDYRLSWLLRLIDQDRDTRREIRRLERVIESLLDEHDTTLHNETGIRPIAAATLLCEVGNPNRFAPESKFARWCGVGPVALSSGEGPEQPNNHRFDFGGNRRINSVFYMAPTTQTRDHPDARRYLDHKATKGKTKRSVRRAQTQTRQLPHTPHVGRRTRPND